jgi:peptidoglycan/LPS O-acetylase OafA/YrhL
VQSGPTKILPLTAARFFAALYIVLYHLSLREDQAWLHRDNLFVRWVHLGFVSVSFFFFLSGFVLAVAYCHQRSSFSVRDFLVARFARIYPALFACLMLDLVRCLFVDRVFVHDSLKHIVAVLFVSFTALEAWLWDSQVLDPPTWTISVEMLCYLLFPWLGILIWRLRPRSLIALSILLYALSNLFLAVLIGRHASDWSLYIDPIAHLPEFLLGVCLARYIVTLQAQPQRHARMQARAPVILILSALAFGLISIFNLPIPAPLLQHAVLAPLFALAVLALSSGHKTISAIFSAGWLVLLGEASFSLYLVHMPLMNLFRVPIARYPIAGTTLCIALALAYSVASYLWLETPARRFIVRKARARNRESDAVASVAQ